MKRAGVVVIAQHRTYPTRLRVMGYYPTFKQAEARRSELEADRAVSRDWRFQVRHDRGGDALAEVLD